MEQDEVALIKAIESGESELGTFPQLSTVLMGVFIVLQQLRKKLPLAQFFRVINDKPAASQLFESWAKNHDRELLKDFYYQDDRKSASAGILIQESLEQTVRPPRINPPALTPRLSLRASTDFNLQRRSTPNPRNMRSKQRFLLLIPRLMGDLGRFNPAVEASGEL
jgi:hypothetical protein